MSQPLSMRLPEADVAIIDRAAARRGRSRTDFVREAAVRAAEEVLMEPGLIQMSPEAFETFRAAVEAPGEAVPALVDLLRRRTPWDVGGR